MEKRSYFPFYRSYWEALEVLQDDNDKKELLAHIINYALNEIEPDFSNNQMFALAWAFVKPNLDASLRHYHNGKKGGCPEGSAKPSMIGNKNAKQNQNKTKTKPKQNQIKENEINDYREVNTDERTKINREVNTDERKSISPYIDKSAPVGVRISDNGEKICVDPPPKINI